MKPQTWALIARELVTIRQLARNWLDPPKAAKVERHAEVLRQLIREATGGREDTRRSLLWWRDPSCFWCGRPTRLDRTGGPDAATLDHIHRRGERGRRHFPRTVLACYGCNHARGQPPPRKPPMCPLLRRRT